MIHLSALTFLFCILAIFPSQVTAVGTGRDLSLMQDGCLKSLMQDGCLTSLMQDGCLTSLMQDGCLTSLMQDGCLTSLRQDGCLTSLMQDGCLTSLMQDGCLTSLRQDALPAISPPHEYHVCITQVDYNPTRSALEISVKLFADDIEKAITKLGGPAMHLGEAREVVGTDSLLSMYLRHKLAFSVDGNALQWRWVGHEAEHDEVWCYLEITGVGELPSLQITNGILTEVYEDQSNAVHVKVGTTTKSLFFNRIVLKGSLSF